MNTGYSTYAYNVLKRLIETGKYEVAELGCYGTPEDPRQGNIPWKHYFNVPLNDHEKKVYDGSPFNEFGRYKWEQTALDFKPDIVFTIRDTWHDEFVAHSPFRRLYDWVYLAPVDGWPQNEQWIDLFMQADRVLTYNDWSLEVLKRQGNGKIKLVGSAPPCADTSIFTPVPDKSAHKMNFGLQPDSLIIGTVMRNQKRKLFPDLIESFRKLLDSDESLAHRCYLYLHTSIPDVGWDLVSLINQFGVSHKVLFTYTCRKCGFTFPNFWSGPQIHCYNCKFSTAVTPNSQIGIETKGLAAIYNLFDVYVQYHNSEGFGIPVIEAAACGLPIFTVDYSAQEDVGRKVDAIMISAKGFHKEAETGRYFAIPDNDQFIRELKSFLEQPESLRKLKGFKTLKAYESNYSWDKTASIWDQTFDQFPVNSRWGLPPNIHQLQQIPDNLRIEDFVRFACAYIAGKPDLAVSYFGLRMIKDLTMGARVDQWGGVAYNELSFLGGKPRYRNYTREDALKELYQICEMNNAWEQRRWETMNARS